MTSLTMKLLGVVSVCLVTWCEITFGDENGPVVVEEGSDVILPCSLSINIESKLFDWKKDGQKEVFLYDEGHHYNKDRTGQDEHFKGRVSHFQDQLKRGNASILIRNTKVSDSGNYTCAFPRLQPSQIFHMKLVVGRILRDRSEENIPGAAQEPFVTILDETKDWVLLQCVVRGASPKPKVEWQDSSGNILHAEEPQVSNRGGRYYITLNTTVTKTDNYRCVVTQEEIGHQTHSKIFVQIYGPEPPRGSVTGLLIAAVLGGLFVFIFGVILLAVLVAKGCIKLDCTKGPQTETIRDEQRDSSHSDNLIQKV